MGADELLGSYCYNKFSFCNSSLWKSSGYLVLGAFSVDVPTLNRFFALHYLFPFLLSGLIILHLFFLHEAKSGDPLGISVSILVDGIPFGGYYIIKDLFGFIYYFLVLFILVFYFPNLLGHSDNYILANPTVTPAHIVPEWYFLEIKLINLLL